MADDSSGGTTPSIPDNTNWSEWTFEQALTAVTGEGTDLHTLANGTWFNFSSSPGASNALSYHAFGDYYIGVDFNQDAIDKWAAGVDQVDGMMGDVANGTRGSMDLQTLRDLEHAIRLMAAWSDWTAAGIHAWSNALDSDDSAFKGKAAFLIQWRLRVNGDGGSVTIGTCCGSATRHHSPTCCWLGGGRTRPP